MFFNVSNHPLSEWDEEQRSAAEVYGEIKTLPFPTIAADADEGEICHQSGQYFIDIMELGAGKGDAALVQGEFTFTYNLVHRLKDAGLKVVAACSERDVTMTVNDKGETVKNVRFKFRRFREYV